MTNLPATINNSLTIQTIDGQTIDLTNFNPLDVVTPSSSGKPLYRVAVGQPRDDRHPDASNQLFLTRKLRVDGQRVEDYVGPLGTEVTVYPLAVWANRSYMPEYTKNSSDPNANKPLCHSENFITPDPRFAGKYATQCCALNPKTGRIVEVCQLAFKLNDENGRFIPPACSEQYILFGALNILTGDDVTPHWEVVEIYFSRSGATNGRNLTQKLNVLQKQGVDIFQFAVKLTVAPAGQGNKNVGEVLPPFEATDEEKENFRGLAQRALDAIAYRKEQALRTDEQGENAGDEIPFDTTPAPSQPSQPAQVSRPTQPVASKPMPAPAAPVNGNGKKKSLI